MVEILDYTLRLDILLDTRLVSPGPCAPATPGVQLSRLGVVLHSTQPRSAIAFATVPNSETEVRAPISAWLDCALASLEESLAHQQLDRITIPAATTDLGHVLISHISYTLGGAKETFDDHGHTFTPHVLDITDPLRPTLRGPDPSGSSRRHLARTWGKDNLPNEFNRAVIAWETRGPAGL